MNYMVDFENIATLLLPVVVEAIKHYVNIPTKMIPIINIVIGIVLSMAFNPSDLIGAIPAGIIRGLVASGLYDVSKGALKVIGNEK